MIPLSLMVITKSTGGLAFYNRLMLTALDPARVRARVVCLSENAADYAEEMRGLGFEADVLDMDRYGVDPVGDLRVARRLAGLIRDRRPDVLLCHGSKPGFIGRAVGAALGVPTIYCQASLPFLHRVQGVRAPAFWALELLARAFGGEVVALTEGARGTTIRHGLIDPSRIGVVRTGVDIDRFRDRGRRAAMKRELGLDPDRPTIGWMGRLEPQKAPHDYLDALERLVAGGAEAQLLMVGEGRLDREIMERISRGPLQGRLALLPWRSDPETVLEALDIFVMTSRWEGLPLVLLEAMASGAAVVSTDVDGCAEAVEDGETGRLVPAGSPAAAAAAVADLLADPAERLRLSAAARARVDAEFDRRVMAERWTRLLTRAAASRRPALKERTA